jgi:predicted secreted protein
MAKTVIKGRDVALFVQKPGGAYVRVSCVGDVGLTITTDTEEATCVDSGEWKEFVAGQNAWTATASLTARTITDADVDTNVSVSEFVGFQIAQTPLLMRFTMDDNTRYGGTVLITQNDLKGQLTGAGSGAVSFQGTGPLTPVAG